MNNIVETAHGTFELIKNEQDAFKINDFDNKFVEILKKYEFIVGDYNQNNLRLKGFNKDNVKFIPDYINEYCSLDSQYYILRNPSFDVNYVVSEE